MLRGSMIDSLLLTVHGRGPQLLPPNSAACPGICITLSLISSGRVQKKALFPSSCMIQELFQPKEGGGAGGRREAGK